MICLSLPAQDQSCGISYLKQYSVRETYQLHTHDFYEFFYICKGKSVHAINGTNQVLEQGMIVFIRPADVHKFEFLNRFDMHIISCGVDAEMMNHALSYLEIDPDPLLKPLLPPVVVLEGPAFMYVMERLDKIGKIAPGKERRTYFLSILPELIYLFYRNPRKAAETLPEWFSSLLIRMNEVDHFVSGLDTMIELSNVSQEHLSRVFRKYMQMTPTEFINLKRLNYACTLLLQDEQNVLDACLSSGFSSLSYFYKVFHRYYNCTPMQFIRKYNGREYQDMDSNAGSFMHDRETLSL